MKIYKNFIAAALLLVMIVPISSFAADTNPNAGLTPRSPLYFLDIFFEKVDLFFTFNPANKARKNVAYAAERIAEMEESAIEKDTTGTEKATKLYEQNVKDAVSEAKELKDKKESEAILNAVSDDTSQHEEALKKVLDKAPDEAKPAIQKAVEVSRREHQQILKELETLKREVGELKEKTVELKQETTEIRQNLKSAEACNDYNRIRADVVDTCGGYVSPYPGVNACIWQHEIEYKNSEPPNTERELKTIQVLKSLKSAYLNAAQGCGISLEEENRTSEQYIEARAKKTSEYIPYAGPIVDGEDLGDLPRTLWEEWIKGRLTAERGISRLNDPAKSLSSDELSDAEITSIAKLSINLQAQNATRPTSLKFYAHDTIKFGWTQIALNESGWYGPGNSYKWNFGDGNTLTTTEPSVSHEYCKGGPFRLIIDITRNGRTISIGYAITALTNPPEGYIYNQCN